MTAETPLDRAWETANTELAGDAEMARFYDIFAATELFLLIDPDTLADGKTPKPLTFPVEGAETALVFDTEARLAGFMEDGAAHLTMSGRAVISMFKGTGAQLGLNLGDAPSATILPAQAIDWASEALTQPIETTEIGDAVLTVPRAVMPDLLQALDGKLAGMGAVVSEAWLCGLGASAGRGKPQPMVLCVCLRERAAEQSVVSALAETARFTGGDAPAYDIAVLPEGDAKMEAARKVGLGFEPQNPEAVMQAEPVAPGMDPDKPPKLR